MDFSAPKFFTPFAVMFILQQIEHYRSLFPSAQVQLKNFLHLSWPRRMKMFSMIDEDGTVGDSNDAFEVESNNSKYIPITSVITKDFVKESGRSLSEVNEAVDRMAANQTTVLTQLGSGYAFDIIQYSLRELMRNVFEHSGSKHLRFCAQYWPITRTAELIIADHGMGIHTSLAANPQFRNLDRREILHYACLPGVSGNAAAIREKSTGNPWRNSGYGLYMTSRLCRNDGDFLIMSSDRALYLREKSKRDFEASKVRGTIIRMHLVFSETQSLRERLLRYTAEGKVISETIKGAKVLSASVASQMLRRDFEGSAE